MAETVLIKNTELRCHSFSEPPRFDSVALVLLPGVNEVAATKWRAIARSGGQALVDEGILEQVGKTYKEHPLRRMSDVVAAKLVRETYGENTLRRWDAAEKRARVKAAIKKQLEAVTLTEEEKQASYNPGYAPEGMGATGAGEIVVLPEAE